MNKPHARAMQDKAPEMFSMKRVSASLLIIAIANIFAGYFREIVLAMILGASNTTDAFMGSYTLIITLNDLLTGAVLTVSIIPVITPLVKQSINTLEERRQLVTTVTLITAVGTILLAILLYILMPQIMHILVLGFNPDTMSLAVSLGHWIVWLLPAQALFSLFVLCLNAHNNYILPASGYLIINLLFSITILLFYDDIGINALPLAVMVGPITISIILFIKLNRLGILKGSLMPNFKGRNILKMWTLTRPMLFTLGLGSSLGLLMLSHLILRHYASFYGEGAIAALSFAFRIYEVPLTITTNTVGIMVLPIFSSLHYTQSKKRMAELCNKIIIWGLILLSPAIAILLVEAEFIVKILLERGNFTPKNTLLTAQALRGFAPAIIFEATFIIFFRIFYALHSGKISIIIGITTIASLITMLELSTIAGVGTIAFCLSASFAVAAICVFIGLYKIIGKSTFPSFIKTCIPPLIATVTGVIWFTIKDSYTSISIWLAIPAIITYCIIYLLTVLFLLPEQKKELVLLIKK